MKRIKTAGTLTLALALGGCAAKQPPTPPPLKIVTEAAPKQDATLPPPTGAELLAQQPREVQEAVKDHQQDGKWPVYRTAEVVLYPYGEEPERSSTASRCGQPTSNFNRGKRSLTLLWGTPSAGWRRRRLPATRATQSRISR